jgi:hypothetical protein
MSTSTKIGLSLFRRRGGTIDWGANFPAFKPGIGRPEPEPVS